MRPKTFGKTTNPSEKDDEKLLDALRPRNIIAGGIVMRPPKRTSQNSFVAVAEILESAISLFGLT